MKKLMKAIAFTTVMCMLLSTAAFAAIGDPSIVADYKFNVAVTANADEQVALLVLVAGTELSAASNENIVYVDQKAATSGTASFDNIVVDSTKATAGKVDIYAGYASNSEDGAVKLTNIDVVATKTVSVSLEQAIEIYPDLVEWVENNGTEEVKSIEKPEGDIAALALADVVFNNPTQTTAVTKVGWEFTTGAETRYVAYDLAEGFNVMTGTVKLGISFSNGSKVDNSRTQFVTENTTAKIYFLVDGEEMEATLASVGE